VQYNDGTLTEHEATPSLDPAIAATMQVVKHDR
jgi:hypothetical protein